MKWGLVLAGGGTRGAYQIGVCRAVKDMGMEIGCVAGTSVGALNGALFVQGDLSVAERLWLGISADKVFGGRRRGVNMLDARNLAYAAGEVLKYKYIDTDPLDILVKKTVSEDRIRASGIDFGVTLLSVEKKREKNCFMADIPYGELADHILASARFAFFRPKNIRSSYYIDAGIMNNMPTDMVVRRGVRDIIEVDAGGPGRKKRISVSGRNIITISAQEPAVGVFEFDSLKIRRSMKQGYLDAKKAFGELWGRYYYFEASEYINARSRYSQDLIEGIEYAAKVFGIERLRVYSPDTLINEVTQAAKRLKGDNSLTGEQRTVIKKLRSLWNGENGIYRYSKKDSPAELGAGAVVYFSSLM